MAFILWILAVILVIAALLAPSRELQILFGVGALVAAAVALL